MTNKYLTNDIIAKTSLASFKNNLALAMTANIQYRNEFEAGRGDTLRIEKPVRYTVREGAKASVQDITETSTAMTVAHQDGVDLQITSKQRTLDLRNFNRTILEPAMQRLANQVDCRGIQAGIDNIYHTVGSAGSKVKDFGVVNEARALLNKVGVQGEYLVMNLDDSVSLQNSLQNSFNSTLNKSISEKASLGRLANLDVYESPNMSLHTVGDYGGKPVVAGAAQTGNTLNTAGWSPDKPVFNKGDIFYLEGVFTVNPITQQIVGAGENNLQRFIVTENVKSDDKGNAVIPIKTTIITHGPNQTVSNSPADKTPITVCGKANSTFSNNFVYSKDAFSLACVRMDEPRGASYAKTMVDNETGLSIRMVEDYNVNDDVSTIRFDILYGWLCNSEYAARIVG